VTFFFRKDYLKVYISTDILNLHYRVEMREPTDLMFRKVVYFRLFDNVLDAIGHKLILEQLEKESIDMLICKQNPTRKDKTDIIRKQ